MPSHLPADDSWWSRLFGRSGAEESPLDDLDLDDVWEQAASEFHGALAVLLQTQLGVVLRRGVPVREVSHAPIAGTGRVRFADGTVLIARSGHPGDLTQLAMLAIRHASVRLSAFKIDHSGTTTLLFTTGNPAERELVIEAIGMDQAD